MDASTAATAADEGQPRIHQPTATATAGLNTLSSSVGRKSTYKKKPIHPIDLVEDTFDPIPPHKVPSFVCDFSLFRVAKSMRLLGYDVRCEPNLLGDAIIFAARAEKRIIITGSTKMLPKLAKMRRDDIEYRDNKPPPTPREEKMKRKRDAAVAARNRILGTRKPQPRTIVGYDSDGASIYDSDEELKGGGEEEDPRLLAADLLTAGIGEDGDHAEDDDEDEDDYVMSYVKIHSSDTHDESMVRVLQTLQLPWDESRVFTRCVDCNVLIESVPNREDVEGLVPAGVFEIYSNFYHCTSCKKVYWGVDNGVAVNYKSVRTIEYLRQYRGAFANQGNSAEVMAKANTSSNSGGNSAVMTPTVSDVAVPSLTAAAAAATSDGSGSAAAIRSHNGAPIDVMRLNTRNSRFVDFTLRRHFSSLPRPIKQRIFSFLIPEDILAVAEAIPTVKQLATACAKGEVFKPALNSRQLKREYRRKQLDAAQQTGQAPFVRGVLKSMMLEADAKKAN